MSDANSYILWLNRKLKLNTKFQNNTRVISSWKVKRGQIYTCYLGENIGFEKSRLEARPCVIVSTNQINHNSGNVIVVPLSKNIKYTDNTKTSLKYPYHYVLKKANYPKLAFDSSIQCEDIRCISKARICTYICDVSRTDMRNLRNRLKSALQL